MARTKIDLEGDPSIEQSRNKAIMNQKKESVLKWFNATCVDDKEKMLAVCAVTSRILAEEFEMRSRVPVVEVWALVFYQTFMSILEFLAKKREKYTEFEVQIAKCVGIGYTNYIDEEDEKVGNFLTFMEWIGKDTPIVYNDHQTHDDNFIRWKEQNSCKNVEMYKEIQDKAAYVLNTKYELNIGTPEAVIPIFCVFLDTLVNILKQDYHDLGDEVSKVSMNVLGQFYVTYSFDIDEKKEIVDFSPSVTMKMDLKDDTKADAK